MPRPITGELGLAAATERGEFVHLLEFIFSGGSLRMHTGTQDLTTEPYGIRIGNTVDRFLIKNPVESPWPTTECTIECWGKIDAGAGTGASNFAVSYARAAQANEMVLSCNGLQLTLYINGTATSDPVAYADTGQWHHMAATWNSSGGVVKLYIDGVLRHTATSVQSAYSIAGGGALVIGQDQDSLAGGFDAAQAWEGELDGIRIYRRVLSDAEILEHYNRRYVNETKLVAHYQFDAFAKQELLNPGLESGSTGWTLPSGVTIVEDGNARTGTWAIRYATNDAAGPNVLNNRRLPVRPGQRVNLEAWVKGVGSSGSVSLGVRWYNAAGSQIGVRNSILGTGTITGPVAAYTRLYGISEGAPAGVAYAEFDIGENAANNTGTPWYFDDLFFSLAVGTDSGPLANHLSSVGITEVEDGYLARTWFAVGGLLSFGGVEEAGDTRGQGVDVKLSGVTQTAIAALMGGTTYRGRAARIWRAHLDSTLGVVIDEPQLLIEGLQLSPYEIKEDRDSREGGTVTVSTRLMGRMGVERVRGIWANLTSHQHLFPGDTFFRHVAQLANSRVFWGVAVARSPTGGGGSGGSAPDGETQMEQ